MFSTVISGLFTPRIHKIVCSDASESSKSTELTKLFIKVGRIQFMVLGLVASGLVIFGHEFIIRIWAGEGYSESYYVMIILAISSTIALTQNIGIEIQRALNLHKFRAVLYAIMAVGNFVASIFLCKKYGAVGSAIGTGVSLIVCNGIIMNIYYSHKCNLNVSLFWKNIFSVLKGFILPALAAMLLRFIPGESLMIWLLKVGLYTVVYCFAICCFSMNPYEKALLKKPLALLGTKIRRGRP